LIFFYSQFGSILAIVILPSLTLSPTAHQMEIQKCEIQEGVLNDIRDYSSNWLFIYWNSLNLFCFFNYLVPVYILAVLSVILVICFISFFHCEYRRQRKDEIEHNALVIHTDSETI